jgi:hypothetical protein
VSRKFGRLRPTSPRRGCGSVRSPRQATAADWQRRNAEQVAATGKGLGNRKPVPATGHSAVKRAAAVLERARARAAAELKAAKKAAARTGLGPVRNVTDRHYRLMHVRGGGFIQGTPNGHSPAPSPTYSRASAPGTSPTLPSSP